jgi:hypothetical protein
MVIEEKLVLHDVQGMGEDFMLLDGVDQYGKVWVFRKQSGDRNCALCSVLVTEGWFCFNDGKAVCPQHVSIKGELKKDPVV